MKLLLFTTYMHSERAKHSTPSFLTSNGRSNKVKARSAIIVLEWMVLTSSEEGQMKVKVRSSYNSTWVDARIEPHSKVK